MYFWLGLGILLITTFEVSAGPTVTAIDLQEGKEYRIESLDYPEPIPANTQQAWTLQSPPGTNIKLFCYDVRMHQPVPTACTVDVLEIRDGAGKKELCGGVYDYETVSSGNVLNVFLQIGPAVSGGVLCWASIVNKKEETPNETEELVIHPEITLDLVPGGEVITFTTPGYPQPMPTNMRQSWLIKTAAESRIRITCPYVQLFENSVGKCSETEVLRITDGQNVKDLCGLSRDYTSLSSGNVLKVEINKGKQSGGGVWCTVEAKVMDWYGEATTTTPKPWVHPESEEIDSSEHGGPPGPKRTTCPCGWANKNSKRIIGGRETNVNEYPFMAGLFWKGSGGPHCGGTIITAYHVLTAAHCVREDGNYFVSLGNHDYTKGTNATQSVDVRRVIVHEKYAERKPNFDIALLVLDRKIDVNQFVGPACLPKELLTLDGQYVKPIGWGMTKPFDDLAIPWLKEVDVRVVPYPACSYLINLSKTERHQICQFSKRKGMGRGDSGGPVVWNDPQTNRYTLVGIPSFVYLYNNDDTNRLPDVSADVSSFLPWIHSKVKETNPEAEICTAED